jgi:hypothetical protein
MASEGKKGMAMNLLPTTALEPRTLGCLLICQEMQGQWVGALPDNSDKNG